MKDSKKNIKILKLLGFSNDFEHTKNPADIDWYSLPDGWGFRLDAHKTFKSLIKELRKGRHESHKRSI